MSNDIKLDEDFEFFATSGVEFSKGDKLKLSAMDRELESKIEVKTMDALMNLIINEKTTPEFIRGIKFAFNMRRSYIQNYASIGNK